MAEVEEMSRTTSPSTHKPYSLVRVCRVWRWDAPPSIGSVNPRQSRRSDRDLQALVLMLTCCCT
jgi:hypothetical protein